MNDDIPSRVLAIEARGRYEVSYFALKRASPADTSMSAPSSAQQDIREACENARARIVRVPLRETGLSGRETGPG